jgi:hypothetical protein
MTIVIITLLSLFIGAIKVSLCWRGDLYHKLDLVQERHAMITSMQHVVMMILKLKMLHNYFSFMFFGGVVQFHVVSFYNFSCTCLALFCVVATPLNSCFLLSRFYMVFIGAIFNVNEFHYPLLNDHSIPLNVFLFRFYFFSNQYIV